MTDNVWHYTDHDGIRHGPVEAESLKDMIQRKILNGSEYVWTNQFGPDWKLLAGTELWQETGQVPPLPVESINGAFAWSLAVAPLLYALIERAIFDNFNLTENRKFLLLMILFTLANYILSYFDAKMIKRTGNSPPSLGWGTFLVPAYLWLRSRKLRTDQYPLVVWIVLFIVSLAI